MWILIGAFVFFVVEYALLLLYTVIDLSFCKEKRSDEKSDSVVDTE